MNLKNLNNQIITFCAIALLFLGSLYYFVSVAFHDRETLHSRQSVVNEYIDGLEESF